MIDINAYFEDKLLVLHNFFSLFMFYELILNFHLDFGSINYYPKDGSCCNTPICNVIGLVRCTTFWLALKFKLKASLIWFNLGLFERSLIFFFWLCDFFFVSNFDSALWWLFHKRHSIKWSCGRKPALRLPGNIPAWHLF